MVPLPRTGGGPLATSHTPVLLRPTVSRRDSPAAPTVGIQVAVLLDENVRRLDRRIKQLSTEECTIQEQVLAYSTVRTGAVSRSAPRRKLPRPPNHPPPPLPNSVSKYT